MAKADEVRCRWARSSDVQAIASLHAESWRRNYRGAYLDSFLDGDVVADRLDVWTTRLVQPLQNHQTIVADLDGAVIGFAHTMLDDDPIWGALLDNLHVAHHMKGRGIGTQILRETGQALVERRPLSGLYLWVLDQNKAAQAFYDARGGMCVGRKLAGPFPGGGSAIALRYAWPDPATL